MSHTRLLRTVVVTCLRGVALAARVVDAAASSALQLELMPIWAQTPSSPSPADTRATGGSASAEDLAKQLSNPIVSLISVPFQSNFDFNAGQDNDQFKYTMNLQPVIPLSLSADWNLIARIIQPVIYQDELFPGVGSTFGLGDLNPACSSARASTSTAPAAGRSGACASTWCCSFPGSDADRCGT